MPPTTRLTSALAGRGKAVAAAAAAAGVLAAGGAASAATLSGSAPAAHESAHHVATHAKTAQVETTHSKVVAAAKASKPAKPAAPAKSAAPAAPAKSAKAATVAKPAAKAAKPAAAAKAAKRAAPAKGAKPAAAAKAAKRAAVPAGPYRVYDSVTPSQIPAGQRVATYADGGYAVNPANVASRGHVVWIDTNGSDPRAAALDVEPGDATPQMAAQWAWHKLHAAAGQVAIIYTMRSEWAATQAAVGKLPAPMQHQVKWWIADPTGVPHIVPGADATQWYWGHSFDITTARPGSGM